MTEASSHKAEVAVGSVRLSDRVADTGGLAARQPFTVWTWAKIIILGGIIIGMNRHQFPLMVKTWWRDPNWSHGFLIPLFSIYLIYVRFGEIIAAERKVCLWGLAAVGIVGILHVYPYRIQNAWACQVTMVMLATGVVLYLSGRQAFKLLWLPILFLVFAMPVSQTIYNNVAFRLQNLAADWAAITLRIFTVQVDVRGSTLYLIDLAGEEKTLGVEEACSGVRLLMAFVALSVAMAYMADRPIWQRVILVGMGIPVAIACNILRVVITCVMYIIGQQQFGEKFMHEFTGMLMLIPAVGMLWLAGLIMRKLFVEEEIDDDEDQQSGSVDKMIQAEGAS